jgi:MarR family transcriptional regulator, organic hydroperoxide resistance regulator
MSLFQRGKGQHRRKHCCFRELSKKGTTLPDADDPLDLDRQVCFSLYAASNLLNRLYRPVLAGLGLTYPQYLVMLVLWKLTPQTVGSLGAMLHLDSGTLTPLLKRMEQAGLVSRTRDTQDERRVLIGLTPKGRELRSAAQRVPEMLGAGLNIDEVSVIKLRGSVRAFIAAMAGS